MTTATAFKPIAWKLSDSESYWYGLECLPPAMQTSVGFLVGEPYSHRTCGVSGRPDTATFTAFAEIGEAYFKAVEPMTCREFMRLCAADVLAAVPSLDGMVKEYAAWNAAQGLSLGSAADHVNDESLTPAQRAWLADFSGRWEAIENAECPPHLIA
jgi:hypothetical protein